ncbi:MAG: hypothetical protein WEA58_07965 [Balneolaceae bacterium]
MKHNIEVHAIDDAQEVNGEEFTHGNGYMVPQDPWSYPRRW